MNRPVLLSIVIVNYNTKSLLIQCVESVVKNVTKYDYEIIVVDNNSTNGSKEFLQKSVGIKAILNNQNIGFARANNTGIRESVGEYVLILNSDTVILPGSLDRMIEYMINNRNVGVLGPKIVDENNEISQSSWDFMPTIIWENVRKLFSPEYVRRYKILSRALDFRQRKIREVPVLSGACMLIRRNVFATSGFLDENFFLYFEEPDFCARAKKYGWKVVFFPYANIIHLLGKSMEKVGDKTQIYYRQSQLYYYRKYRPRIEQQILKYYLYLKYKIKLLFANTTNRSIYNEIIKIVQKW
ncbi:MAG: glycosyltransferase family 2 protein [Elusimicrobiota bacterium]